MKTIREIAEEIGVSKQAVYKRYKGKLYKAVLPYARMVGGTVYILEQGESIIKQDFLRDSAYGGAHTEYTAEMLVAILQNVRVGKSGGGAFTRGIIIANTIVFAIIIPLANAAFLVRPVAALAPLRARATTTERTKKA